MRLRFGIKLEPATWHLLRPRFPTVQREALNQNRACSSDLLSVYYENDNLSFNNHTSAIRGATLAMKVYGLRTTTSHVR